VRGLKDGSRRPGEPEDLREDEARTGDARREDGQQNAANGTTPGPEATEVRCHSREHDEPTEQKPERNSLLNQELGATAAGRDEVSRPEPKVRRNRETNSAAENQKLSRIRGDDGSDEFRETLHDTPRNFFCIMPYSQDVS
jgi:hypothetical protein